MELTPGQQVLGCNVIRKIRSGNSATYYEVSQGSSLLALRVSKAPIDIKHEVTTLQTLVGLPVPALMGNPQPDTSNGQTLTFLSLWGECAPRDLLGSSLAHVVSQVLDIVAQAHNRGVTHGNLKPSKILMSRTSKGQIGISGFGCCHGGSRMADLLAVAALIPQVPVSFGPSDSNYLPLLHYLRENLKKISAVEVTRDSSLPMIPRPVLLAGQILTAAGEVLPITASSVLLRLLDLREGDGQAVRHELSKVGGFSRVFPPDSEGGREALAVAGMLACLPQEGAVQSSSGPVCFAQLLTGVCGYGSVCPLVHSEAANPPESEGLCVAYLATGHCAGCSGVHVETDDLDDWVAHGKLPS